MYRDRGKSKGNWLRQEGRAGGGAGGGGGGAGTSNPYSNLNLSRVETNRSYISVAERGDLYGATGSRGLGGKAPQSNFHGNSSNNYNNGNNKGNNTLQVPGAYSNQNNDRQHNRRYSIHTAAHQHGRSFSNSNFDTSNAPQLPNLPQGMTMNSKPKPKPLTILQEILKGLDQSTAGDIDDYYKSLVKQKQIVTRDFKDNINQNQKNVMALTKDLKETQEELLNMRHTTKDLFEVLDLFKETAERRLSLERENLGATQMLQQLQQLQKSEKDKRKDRSSILLLEKNWAKELQSLFKHVDGASKFIQPLPGRHVLAESGRWHEVNAGTWKPSNPGHLFVLNDLLLIAAKKTLTNTNNKLDQKGIGVGGGGGGGAGTKSSKLQAIQCLPLTLVTMTKITPPKTDPNLYFISIKTKSLNYVYQTDRYDHFVKITDAFNKGKNEMIHEQRVMRGSVSMENNRPVSVSETQEEKKQLRDSLRNSGSHEMNGAVDEHGKRISGSFRRSGTLSGTNSKRNSSEFVLHDISARVHSRNKSHDFQSSTYNYASGNGKSEFFNSMKNLEVEFDDVDINISRNKFADAVQLVTAIEKRLLKFENYLAKQRNNASSLANQTDESLLLEVTKLKVENRKDEIIQCLLFDLLNRSSKLTASEVSEIIILFQQLDHLESGIQAFLDATSLHLASMVSKLIVSLQGSTKIDVVNYLSNLMVINVAIVQRTINIYKLKINPILAELGQGIDSSGLIDWCIEEFKKLNKTIKKHLYGTLLIIDGHNFETDEPVYSVKDEKLYGDFLNIMNQELEELRMVGLDVEYIFEPIMNLQ